MIGEVQVERGGNGTTDLYERYRRAINVRVRGAHPQMRTFFALLSAILADRELAGHVRDELFQPGIEKAERGLHAAIAGGAMRAVDVPAAARLVYAILLGLEVLAQIGDEETLNLLQTGGPARRHLRHPDAGRPVSTGSTPHHAALAPTNRRRSGVAITANPHAAGCTHRTHRLRPCAPT